VSLEWLEGALAELRDRDLYREPSAPIAVAGPYVERAGRRYLNLCSNDYLSLASSAVASTAGSGASRLIIGDLEPHRQLEGDLATWLGVESALIFSSGYAANVGTIAALVGPGDLVVSDALNHASLIDGCRLSRAEVTVVHHRSVEEVERALRRPARRKLIVTDGYFSMDATKAPVAELARVARENAAALYVDDAHGLGVWGRDGRGVCEEAGIVPDVWMGTLGKAFGAAGAFVAGRRALTSWLWNRARSFVFSTGLAPAAAIAARAALPLVRNADLRARLQQNSIALRAALGNAAGGEGPILPIVVGEPARAVAVSRALMEQQIFVQAIRPPTVPRGTSRLRITVQAGHESGDLQRAAGAIRGALS
jgi:8-amino-7-oxononanoate synthase